MSTNTQMNELLTQNLKKINLFVDQLTAAGSAFAATGDGEQVFINARICAATAIEHGDYIEAWVMPNYVDKSDRVPWRVVRATVIGSAFKDISDELEDKIEDETPLEPRVSKDQLVVDHLSEHGPMRTSMLARLLDVNTSEAGALCHGLFSQGKIVMADVYSDPANKRSSHRVWAMDINDFDIDPFEED